jgi:hypothetical protein
MIINKKIVSILYVFVMLFSISNSLSAQCISGNCKNGRGTFVYPSGARYTGEFKNSEIHGKGVCVYSDGSRYEGDWANRYPEGKGTKFLKDGSKLTGTWKKGVLMDGQEVKANGATLVAKGKQDGDGTTVQSGCINGDCEEGQGIYAYPDGSKYEGQFSKGKIHGWGTFYYTSGDKYVGTFKENVANGKGTIFHADGTQTTGEWKDGEYIGSSMIESGRIGCISGNCVNGKGTYIYKDGEAKYVGEFKDEEPNGEGSVFYANGERYVGQWSNGSFNGKGTLYLKDGTEASGYWSDGEYLGKENPNEPKKEEVVKVEPKKTEETTTISTSEKPNTQKKEATPAEPADLKVWALVIGVSSYDHMPVLKYTDDDAYRMYAFLKSPEGGAIDDAHIKVLIDEEATRESIISNMKGLFAKAGPNDLVMMYFSGHGLKGAFLPIDYDGYNNKLDHEEINQIFKGSPAKYKLCIADACHSGSLFAMRDASAKNALATYYETLGQAQSGTALIMSSKSEETSLESSGLRQGVFSHFLIRGLKGEADTDENNVVNVQELFNFINKNVQDYTGRRQSPVIQGDYDPKMTVAVKR